MLSKVVQEALNEQIANELYSAHLYLAMSAYCQSDHLQGFAHWLRFQSQEETMHAMKFFDWIGDRAGRVKVQAIAQPPSDFKSPLEIMQKALDNERKVSAQIHRIYELAVKEKDYATQTWVQWFVTEQVEEEKQVEQIIEQLKLAGNQGGALIMLDRALGERKGAD